MTHRYFPQPVPEDILHEILAQDRQRLSLPPEALGDDDDYYAAYFEHYMTGMPGYSGPAVVILWGADPCLVTSYIRVDGKWQVAGEGASVAPHHLERCGRGWKAVADANPEMERPGCRLGPATFLREEDDSD